MTTNPASRNARTLRLLSFVGIALFGYGGAGDHSAHAQDMMEADAISAHTTFSVINLGVGETFGPVVNNKGQVAFAASRRDPYRAKFYDGRAVRDLGDLGFPWVYVTGLNDAGQISGFADYRQSGSYDFPHAFLWTQRTGMVDLGALPEHEKSQSVAINNNGQVAGTSSSRAGLQPDAVRAVRWSPGSGILDLGVKGFSFAVGINEAGYVAAGTGSTESGSFVAAIWTPERGMVGLGTLGGAESQAAAINGPAQIAGNSSLVNGNRHAFFWTPGQQMADLGTLGGNESTAIALNDAGQVVGSSTTASGAPHAFRWSGAEGMRDLGTLGGSTSFAADINRSGQIVGRAATRGDRDHAFIWTRTRGMVDLNRRIPVSPPGLVLRDAVALSDTGAVVAMSNAGLVLLVPGAHRLAGPVAGPLLINAPIRAREPEPVTVRFVNANVRNTHRASWSWGDGTSDEAAVVIERNGSGRVVGRHSYRETGSYNVVLTVTDSAGRVAAVTRTFTVCDPPNGTPCEAEAASAP
jgi:probable HAF family extracellular repeat protein